MIVRSSAAPAWGEVDAADSARCVAGPVVVTTGSEPDRVKSPPLLKSKAADESASVDHVSDDLADDDAVTSTVADAPFPSSAPDPLRDTTCPEKSAFQPLVVVEAAVMVQFDGRVTWAEPNVCVLLPSLVIVTVYVALTFWIPNCGPTVAVYRSGPLPEPADGTKTINRAASAVATLKTEVQRARELISPSP